MINVFMLLGDRRRRRRRAELIAVMQAVIRAEVPALIRDVGREAADRAVRGAMLAPSLAELPTQELPAIPRQGVVGSNVLRLDQHLRRRG